VVAASKWASIVEIDLQLSSDGEFVVYHDYTLPSGQWVHETSHAECMSLIAGDARSQGAIDLDSAASLVRDLDVTICLDLKSGMGPEHDIHRRVSNWISTSLPAGCKVHVSDWDHGGLQAIKRACPNVVVRGALRGRLTNPSGIVEASRLDGVNLAWDCTRASDVAKLHRHGVLVAFFGGWSDRFVPHARTCDVDIVISDHPLPPDV
jgi:glycerophosphoryl diester phosphodiesterase